MQTAVQGGLCPAGEKPNLVTPAPLNLEQPQRIHAHLMIRGTKMKPLLWVHEDSMNRAAAPFRMYPEAPAVFVLDTEGMPADEASIGRTMFLYQSALELPCEVRRGDTTTEVLWTARARGCDRVVTLDSPDPEFRRICRELSKSLRVDIIPAATDSPEIDVRKFMGFWKSSHFDLV